ncbi:flagellar basal body P-ring formation chaperone FlgA [Ideonella sp. DXS22W]|uniref:Flagellar basal body P-ring formation chaperone FlgA n=1 Tax=Pseudaquabacterium inlustre TaxID=2984192 RepID=A0ABU9C9S7_9BURK
MPRPAVPQRPAHRAWRRGAAGVPRLGLGLGLGQSLGLAVALALPAPARAADEASAVPAGTEIAQWMRQAAQTALASPDDTGAATAPAATPPRIEVVVGRLDPRLKLAPCQTVQPYLPPGSRAIGQTRIGLRCTQGPKAWNVYLPVTVKVFARSLVATTAVPAGTVLQRQHLTQAEVDVAASTDPAIGQPDLAVGRTLARNLAAGDALRQADLKPRLWFAAGDTVRVVAMGPGFQIAADGQALSPGIDGQTVRARIDGGRIVSGVATADRRIEVPM